MESVPVRRKSCLLRLRDNWPFRKLRRQTYDVHMDEDPPAAENQQNQENPESRAEDCMDLDDDVDPETGERAQG